MEEQKIRCKGKKLNGTDCPHYVIYKPKKTPGSYMVIRKEVYLKCDLGHSEKYEVDDTDGMNSDTKLNT